jgi:hypothetical protein
MLRRTRCPLCKNKLLEGQRIHPECIDGWAERQAAKAKAAALKADAKRRKVDRATDRARRRALETIPELIKAAQKEFNAYIRQRDKDQPCICCGRPLNDAGVGGAFDCGHYRSVGSASHLRFNELNAHGQTKHCNRYGSGRAVDYRIGLIARVGLDAVEALENDNKPHKWTADELRQIRDTYKARLKAMKKEQE